MTDHDDKTALALRQLGTSAVPLERADDIAARRARLVPALSAFADGEAARAARRPWRRRTELAALALAAALGAFVIFFGARHAPREATVQAKRGTVHVIHRGATSDVSADLPRALSEADELETLDGTAEVSLVTGAVVDLSAQSRLELTAVDRSSGAVAERVRVSSGKVNVHVPKLPTGSKLSIGTPDTTVTVHGTAFTVEVTKTPEGTVSTTVVVTDGRVAVASGGRELFLDPGSRWSSAPKAAPVASSVPASVADQDAPPSVSPPGAPSSAARRSTLRDENELFREAMDADRAGKLDQVVTLTDRLLRAHPDSPLAADARTLQLEAQRKRAARTPP